MTTPGRVDAPQVLLDVMEAAAASWSSADRLGRVWQRDGSVWTGRDEGHWLGWLDVPDPAGAEAERLDAFASRVHRDGFRCAALLGMGGSSLFPEMLRRIFGHRQGVDLRVLDSTDPAQIAAFESTLDLDRTLFVVSSKSGGTLETRLFQQYFFGRVRERLGSERAGARFVAVTDPGSALDRLATEQGFRAVFHGEASIGGRYSALSYFGLVPAAIMGLDVRVLMARARAMAAACGPETAGTGNPGVQLGLLLGLAARAGHDKVTLATSAGLDGLADWIEQLLAESTGKQGQGLIPVVGEPLADPATYGGDRLFLAIGLDIESDEDRDEALDRLSAAGHPVVRHGLRDPYDVAAECFRWEFATAVAGAVMGVHPFDQPDVEASKAATRAITSDNAAGRRRRTERPPAARAGYETGEITAHVSGAYATRLRRSVGADAPLERWVAAHLRRLRPGDYFAVLAYVAMCEPYRRILDELRHHVRQAKGVATTAGFGPRFLHSTGQVHKGGPDTGLFLVVTCGDIVDIDVPDHPQSFGTVKAAQALGDCEVLAARKRRWLRLHIDGEVGSGLTTVASIVADAVGASRR